MGAVTTLASPVLASGRDAAVVPTQAAQVGAGPLAQSCQAVRAPATSDGHRDPQCLRHAGPGSGVEPVLPTTGLSLGQIRTAKHGQGRALGLAVGGQLGPGPRPAEGCMVFRRKATLDLLPALYPTAVCATPRSRPLSAGPSLQSAWLPSCHLLTTKLIRAALVGS